MFSKSDRFPVYPCALCVLFGEYALSFPRILEQRFSPLVDRVLVSVLVTLAHGGACRRNGVRCALGGVSHDRECPIGVEAALTCVREPSDPRQSLLAGDSDRECLVECGLGAAVTMDSAVVFASGCAS